MFARTHGVALFTVAGAWKVDDGAANAALLVDAGLVAVAFYLNGASVACH